MHGHPCPGKEGKGNGKGEANQPAGRSQASDVEFDFERLPAYRRAEDFVMWAYGHMGG